MYSHPQHGHDQEAVAQLRQEAGKLVRKYREAAGLSQRELAGRVGMEYYTFISQIEAGRGRVPPMQIRPLAEALGVPVKQFAIELMRFYDPVNYDIIFGGADPAVPDRHQEIIAQMEDLLKSLGRTVR